eukprot:CAMPEP_0119493826 /NCGR_PEP_ID=MMETSP1344-20130328/17955_1 /TAXON_ID=236787 /ORGANISM="Florenciella parvula, Strain CCMP2471" /LENGTH=444 /DNA_ID=CAMNT_0007529285 /DNA_START=75 /DNA_END=1409 /DNA_ORIENTATION=+
MSMEEAKQFLRAEPADGGPSLYDHLSQTLLKVIIERPADANQFFEEISAAVRTEATKTVPPPADEGAEEAVSASKAAQLKWVDTQAAMFVESTEEAPEVTFPDLYREAAMWKWAGIGFGDDENYRLYLALKALAVSKETGVRFWGKIITRGGDYYVAETKSNDEDFAEIDANAMEGAMGPNKYTYFVTKGTGEAWTQLPHVTSKQIVVARQVKRFLTGDLTAPVCSYPPFPGGTEANLLRAQIAQITADCVLSLKGLVQADEDSEEKNVVPVEEEEQAVDGELGELSTWVHAEIDIMPHGRCQALPEKDEDEEGGDDEPAVEYPDPKEPCGEIGEDVVEESGKQLWILRTCPGGAGVGPKSAVYAKSMKWPGAIAVAVGKKVTNVYVGFGLAAAAKPQTYSPPMPAKINPEWGFPVEEEEEPQLLTEEADVTVAPPKEEEEEDE